MIAALAARQGGVVARRQLVARGLSRHEVDDRLASGHLVRIHRGVYAIAGAFLGARGRRWAAVLAVCEGASISHRTALAEHDLRPDNRTTVDVTSPRHARKRKGITVHESRLEQREVATINRLPVTTLPRTLLDVAQGRPPAEITKLLERADKLALLDARAIDDVIARNNGHRGTGVLQRALELFDPRHHNARSDWERDVLPLLDALPIPRPIQNAILGPYEVDFYWPDHRLVVELDSWGHHRQRSRFEDDRERDRWLAARGITCVRYTWRQVERGALAELVELLRVRAA